MSEFLRYFRSKNFLIPTILFGLFLIFYLIIFQTDGNKYYSLERTLTQWDAQHYLSIAESGYEMFPCSYGGGYICGNIGWFPLYPVVTGLIAISDSWTNWVMLIFSWLCFYLSLLLLYSLTLGKFNQRAALMTILAIVVFPASFFYLTAFPYSFFLLLSLLAFYCFEYDKLQYLMIFTAALAVTYPSGSLIILPILYYLIKNWKSNKPQNRKWLIASMVSVVVALGMYGLYYLLKFGDFFLYLKFQAQSYYDHQVNFPLLTIWDSFQSLSLSDPINVSLLYIIVGLVLFYNKKISPAYQIFMLAILLFTPTMGTTVCYYRHIVVAFPLFMMIGISAESNWRRYLIPAYLIVAVALNWLIFIPAFRAGTLM